jgi:hypothetical protein
MPTSLVARRLIARLALGLFALGVLGTAQAALYVGAWDPAFGNPYPNLGWRGSVTVFVPPSCDQAGTTGTVLVNNLPSATGPSCNGNAQVTSAQVVLYDLNNASNTQNLDFTGLLSLQNLLFIDGENDLDIVQTVQEKLIPSLRRNHGEDSIEEVSTVRILSQVRALRNYVLPVNMEAGAMREDWPEEAIYVGR